MIKPKYKQSLVLLGKRTTTLLIAVILSMSTLIVSLTPKVAEAAQLANRKVTISTSVASTADVEYEFEFDWLTATTVNSILFQFCTTPLGACTLPTGMDVDNATVTLDAQTNFPDPGTPFTLDTTGGGACNDTGTAAGDTMICLDRTGSATSATGTNTTVVLSGIVNPSIQAGTNFTTVFARVYLYSDSAWATQVHDGTVAAAIVRQITATGRVQERLEFCVAAQTDALWDATKPADCTDIAGADAWPTTTLVDLGVIDNLAVKISPVDNTTTDPANDSFGIAMVDTNASNGVEITYFPEPASSVLASDADQVRSFRVIPTDCSATATTLTDQCFQSAGPVAQAITVDQTNQEIFGLYVACRWHSTGTTAGTLTVSDDYNGDDDDIAEAADCENEAPIANYEVAFDDDPSDGLGVLASSTSVVDDEILAIRFAALAESTTPTGQYTVVTTYIATPTY